MSGASGQAGSTVLADAGYYLHWGVVQISLTNFLIIVGMVVVFVLALVLPFPAPHADEDAEAPDVRR